MGLPPKPYLSKDGYQLILDYEVGGDEKYYNKFLIHPTWPGASSGVTWGTGYDGGYNSKSVILSDWRKSPDKERLSTTSGVTGTAAKSILPKYRDITIPWWMAEEVFNEVTLARFYNLSVKTFPGLEELCPNAQAAIVSCVFNRGSSLKGETRKEMRVIKDLIPKKDYEGIAGQLRAMKRIWVGKNLDGLLKRRDAEAALVETCIKES